MPDYNVTVKRRTAGWVAAVLIALVIALVLSVRSAPAGPSGSITMSLNTVPRTRSINVSPSAATFGNCSGGNAPTASTPTLLGYPNGQCLFGKPGSGGSFPITIKNTGSAAEVDVNGSSAVPSGSDAHQWELCNPTSPMTVACTPGQGTTPGTDQYIVENFSAEGRNSAALTDQPLCDAEFGSANSPDVASIGQSSKEGIKLIGPAFSQSYSTSWTVTITWTAVPAPCVSAGGG